MKREQQDKAMDVDAASLLHALALSVFLFFAGPFVRNDQVPAFSVAFFLQRSSLFYWVGVFGKMCLN